MKKAILKILFCFLYLGVLWCANVTIQAFLMGTLSFLGVLHIVDFIVSKLITKKENTLSNQITLIDRGTEIYKNQQMQYAVLKMKTGSDEFTTIKLRYDENTDITKHIIDNNK
jgi:hypothetical protein